MAADKYDYIFAGAGCAGLSLLARLMDQPGFSSTRVLMLDKQKKVHNDRTWCFWEKTDEPGYFEHLVQKSWDHLLILGRDISERRQSAPYQYKLIRSRDFYADVFSSIERHPNIEVRYDSIVDIRDEGDNAIVRTNCADYSADYVFSSILAPGFKHQDHVHYLDQRFTGWWIKADGNVFDDSSATLMDFRIPQDGCTSFVYLLPVSPNRALVEYTQFTNSSSPRVDYKSRLELYMRTFYSGLEYTVESEESGNIPMTNHAFPSNDGRVIHIGTAGGQTKPSTGYTFQFIQQHSDALAEAILETGLPLIEYGPHCRFQFYDSVLLRVLREGKVEGRQIFTTLFRRNDIADILRFLDNSTGIKDEVRILSSLPKCLFTRAAVRELLHSPLAS